MKFFSNNFCNIKNNYVICNIEKSMTEENNEYIRSIKVLKNILTRGSIVFPSIFLKEKYSYHFEQDKKASYLISTKQNNWTGTIKGDDYNINNPALDFYNSLDMIFKEYKFIKNIIIPEALITDIIGENEGFKNQSVDFYLPQAKLIIEIDGYQHKYSLNQDKKRDQALSKNNTVIRISTIELREKNRDYQNKIAKIKEILDNSKYIREYSILL